MPQENECFETVLCSIVFEPAQSLCEPGEGRDYLNLRATYCPQWVDLFPHINHIGISGT